MDARSRFLAKFKALVVPVLKEEGFRGSGNDFRRQIKEVIHVINLQGSRHGGECCVNLGIHLTFFPLLGSGSLPTPEKITEPECEFRTRLHEPDIVDQWWPYGSSEDEAEASALSIKQTYLNVGRDFLGQFLVFPGDFTRITPESFAERTVHNCPPTFTKTRALLAQARIYDHLGNRDFASRFAKMALADVGRAVLLKAELERLAEPESK
jgi:hypothetical protein